MDLDAMYIDEGEEPIVDEPSTNSERQFQQCVAACTKKKYPGRVIEFSQAESYDNSGLASGRQSGIVWDTEGTSTLQQLQERMNHKKRVRDGLSKPRMGGVSVDIPETYPELYVKSFSNSKNPSKLPSHNIFVKNPSQLQSQNSILTQDSLQFRNAIVKDSVQSNLEEDQVQKVRDIEREILEEDDVVVAEESSHRHQLKKTPRSTAPPSAATINEQEDNSASKMAVSTRPSSRYKGKVRETVKFFESRIAEATKEAQRANVDEEEMRDRKMKNAHHDGWKGVKKYHFGGTGNCKRGMWNVSQNLMERDMNSTPSKSGHSIRRTKSPGKSHKSHHRREVSRERTQENSQHGSQHSYLEEDSFSNIPPPPPMPQTLPQTGSQQSYLEEDSLSNIPRPPSMPQPPIQSLETVKSTLKSASGKSKASDQNWLSKVKSGLNDPLPGSLSEKGVRSKYSNSTKNMSSSSDRQHLQNNVSSRPEQVIFSDPSGNGIKSQRELDDDMEVTVESRTNKGAESTHVKLQNDSSTSQPDEEQDEKMLPKSVGYKSYTNAWKES